MLSQIKDVLVRTNSLRQNEKKNQSGIEKGFFFPYYLLINTQVLSGRLLCLFGGVLCKCILILM